MLGWHVSFQNNDDLFGPLIGDVTLGMLTWTWPLAWLMLYHG